MKLRHSGTMGGVRARRRGVKGPRRGVKVRPDALKGGGKALKGYGTKYTSTRKREVTMEVWYRSMGRR